MEKLYNNARQSYITFYEKGYLRLPAKVKRIIEEKTGAVATDVYIDKKHRQIVLIPTNDGDYTLSIDRSSMMVCLYGARDCGIEPGKHDYKLIEGEDGLQLKIGFRAIRSA